jgi:hypothetical protein
VSARGTAADSKNKHPHKLRSGGYKSAEKKWSKDMKVYSSADSSGISREDCPRAFRFLAGRSKHSEEEKLVPCSDADQELLRLVVIHFPYICSSNLFFCKFY